MQITLLILQIILAIFLVSTILFQKSSSDGISSLSMNANKGLNSIKTPDNILTKITMILAALFMVNSLVLANITARNSKNISIIDKIEKESKHHKKNHNHNGSIAK